MGVCHPYHPVTIGRIFFFLPFVIGLNLARAQEAPLIAVRAAEPVMTISQVSVVAASVIVTNSSPKAMALESSVQLPAGWRLVTRDPSFTLKAGQKDNRLVSFALPPVTPAGRYRVHYFLRTRPEPAETSQTSIEIIVLPVREIRLSLLGSPRFVVAGSEYSVLVGLENRGNVGDEVRLSFRSSEGYRMRTDSPRVFLRPRETREIPVIVSTSGSLSEARAHTTEILALFRGDSSVYGRVASIVNVIPRVAEMRDESLNLPVEVTGRISGEDDRLGGQIEIRSNGSFTESGVDRFHLQVRTPDIQSQSSLGLRDEYRVRYEGGGADLKLGDWSYSLSPLTELNRYGFGVSGTYSLGKVTAGGYVNESRFLLNPPRQVAGHVSYEVIEDYRIGVHYLKKEAAQSSEVSSVRGVFGIHEIAQADVEYGISKGSGRKDHAGGIALSGKRDWLNYNIRHIDAGVHYTGYYRNLNHTSAALSIVPTRLVRLEGYYRVEERNRTLDTTLGLAPKEELLQIGVGYSNIVALYYRTSLYEDRFPVPLYRRKEDIAQLRLGTTFSKINVFSNIDIGRISNQLSNTSYPFQRFALFSAFNIGNSQNYSASFELSNEQNLFTGDRLQRISGSLGASYNLSPGTIAQIAVFLSRLKSPVVQNFGLLEATLQHVFPNQHRIALRARQSVLTTLTVPEVAYTLQYGVPVHLPLKRLSSFGQVRGRVVGESGKGMGTVLVNIGSSAAITDGNGEFLFPALTPGQNYLVIDKSSIGLDHLTHQSMPMTVQVRGGEETRVRLDVTRAASVGIQVNEFAFDELDSSETALVERGPSSGMMLELSSRGEVLRRMTDSRGRVTVRDLRPGPWKVRVTGTLPRFHFLEQESVELNLNPGEQLEANFRILPRRRTMRIIQEGAVIREEAPTPIPETVPQESCLISYDEKQKGYILQVSSWVTRSKALERARVAQRVARLRTWIERTEVTGMGIRYRVKVGLFLTREQAEMVCHELIVLEWE